MATRRYRFTPYRPPSPPAGSYDPALDAQRAAAQRGLFDLTQDVETQGTRATSDYGLTTDQLRRQHAQGGANQWTQHRYEMEDLGTGFNRGSADISRSSQRAGEDYNRNVAMLTRQYQQLGRRQLEGANTAGVLRGGAMLQAAAKRAENESIDRQPLDTNFQRFNVDNAEAYKRMREDYDRGVARSTEGYYTGRDALNQDVDYGLGQAGLQYQRGGQDRTTQLTRAQRENQAFGLDLTAQQAYQATGAGWTPAGRGEPGGMPRNEFANPATGQHYRVINGYRYDQFGRRIGRATGRL